MTDWPVPRTSPEQPAWPERGFRVGMRLDERAIEAGDPEIIEDLRSLSESRPFVTRIRESRGFMKCERCRVPVIAVPEALAEAEPESRKWQLAIWEPETGRKHTLRRCEAMQRHAEKPPGPDPARGIWGTGRFPGYSLCR